MKLKILVAGVAFIGITAALPAAAATNVFEDVIVVSARRDMVKTDLIYGESAPPASADAAGMIGRLPGAALIKNGSLSGQVQFRGAYGVRVGTRINGQAFRSGGPNLMDPPMHYAPPTLVETIEVNRGAAPVAFGPSLVGGVQTRLKQVPFGATSVFESAYDLTVIGRSADDSHALGAVAGVANDSYRFFGFYSTEEGNEADWPGGVIDNTHHDRQVFGAGFGLRTQNAEWNLELRRQDTGPTGNPPFAMDIDYVETDFVQLRFSTTLGSTQVDAALSYSDVDHGMNNFQFRPAPASIARYRQTRALAETMTLDVNFETPFESGDLTYGLDVEMADLEARISNPMNSAFFVEPLPDISQDRIGAYVNWHQTLAGGDVDLGIRMDQHRDDAGTAMNGSAVPVMPSMLALAFNQKDRDQEHTTVDLLARFWKTTDVGTWRYSLARKTRAPTHLERFGWLPIAASAGLADGNNYVGDLGLDPEVAWIAEAGVDLAGGSWWLRPTLFYHRVDDFIQGIPFDDSAGVINSGVEMVSMMNGDMTPLRFANVDARMFGIDADYGWQLDQHWRLEGVLSVVRGERRDISDDLYRISPDRLSLGLVYDRSRWSVTLEGVRVHAQDHVSATNTEQRTAGYGLVNLFATWQASDRILVSGGIENAADRKYRDHLSGYNRVSDSDVPLGSRLPGVGRNVFLKVSIHR